MHFFRKKRKEGWLALTSASEGLCVASVTGVGEGKPRVSLCEFRQQPPKGGALKALLHELGMEKHHCLWLLGPAEYRLLQVDAPVVPAAELKQAVRWRVKDMLEYPVEQATIDVVDIPSDPSNPGRAHLMYAVAARNDLIRERIERLMVGADIPLEAIDVPELAQRNLAALLEEEGRALALLSFNQAGGLLTFTAGGELYHARQIDVTLPQLLIEDEERQSHLFDRVALELQRSLDNFERQFPYVAVNRLLLAPFPAREAFRDFLASYLGLRVETFNLTDIFDFQHVPVPEDLAQQAQMLGVLGAALRGEEVVGA